MPDWGQAGEDGCPRRPHSGQQCINTSPGKDSLCQPQRDVWAAPGERRAGVLHPGRGEAGCETEPEAVGVLTASPEPSLV